jgi:c-di-GMP-binding flagellar brake protein YcgR
MGPERRRHNRHIPLKQNAFAALGQDFAKTGKIVDISLGGLAFEYIVGPRTSNNDDSRVDIFLTDMPLHIRNAQCQAIYDSHSSISQMESDISCSLTVRRTGIKFLMLSEKQREQLSVLISLFCSGQVSQGLENQHLRP